MQPTSKVELCGRKVILCVWWDHHGIIYFEFLNHNWTFNADLCYQQQQHVHENLLRKCPALINWRNVVLLHERKHSARITQE